MFWRQKDFPRELWIKDRWGDSHKWRIKFVRHIPARSKLQVYKDTGLCDPGERIIYIAQGLSALERLTVLFHEWAHAVESETGKKVPHDLVEWFARRMAETIFENAS